MSYAQLYDELYADKDYSGESEFLQQIFRRYATIPVRAVMDFGCGTGNHAVRLAERGLAMTGVDRSKAMLERAAEKARRHGLAIRWEERLPPNDRFEGIICLFAVLNYLESKEAATNLLCEFQKVLSPGGLVILEGWNGTAVPFLSESRKVKEIQVNDVRWRRETRTELDWLDQRMKVHFECYEEPLSDPAISETHQVRYYTPRELSEMARTAGLEVVQVLPAYRWDLPKKEDFNLMTICRRKGE